MTQWVEKQASIFVSPAKMGIDGTGTESGGGWLVQTDVPFFQRENLAKNQQLLKRVAQIADEKKCTTSQLALAWVLHKGAGRAVPIPGTTKIANLESNVAAVGVKLTEEDMKALEDAVPASEVAGERYAAEMISFGWQNAKTPPLSSWTGAKVN